MIENIIANATKYRKLQQKLDILVVLCYRVEQDKKEVEI